jgi:hypothetical protein
VKFCWSIEQAIHVEASRGRKSPSVLTRIVRWALIRCKLPCSIENLSRAQNENYIKKKSKGNNIWQEYSGQCKTLYHLHCTVFPADQQDNSPGQYKTLPSLSLSRSLSLSPITNSRKFEVLELILRN